MTLWGADLYGDPCRECGWSWLLSPADAVAYVVQVPDEYARLLAGRDGTQRHPDLTWSATAYVCHVTDNLRIWAERLAGAVVGERRLVAVYGSDLLAQARRYDAVPLPGALWSLRQATASWTEILGHALVDEVVLLHPDRGEQRAADIARNNAHDAHHHGWDITRCVDHASA